jgi:RND family efflux transporter MFP subunit
MARTRHAITFALAVLAAQATAQEDPAGDPARDLGRPVKLISIETSEIAFERRFFGRVAARQTVDLSFQTSGELVLLPLSEGQDIAKGQLVAQLDLEPFERAVARAELTLKQAQRDAERTAKLQQARTVSEVQAENAQTQADLAELALRDARSALDHATLVAPFDAVVASRNVENYTLISPGMAVARLTDLSELRIHIDVPEVLMRHRNENEVPEMTATFPGSDQEYPLQMREFKSEASEVGQTFRLTLAMDPPEDQIILPGASVTVNIRIKDAEQGVVLPISAIRVNADGSYSALLFDSQDGENGMVKTVPVTVSPTDDGKAFRVEGLPESGELVATGVALLRDGAKVRRFVGFGE